MIVPSPERLVTYESPVSVHVEPDSIVMLTVPPSGIAPLKLELSVRLMVSDDLLSTTISPSMSWPEALSVTLPPLLPELFHFCPSARRKFPLASLFVMVTPDKSIVQVVFVTQNISPLALVMLPSVILNEELPLDASPDID